MPQFEFAARDVGGRAHRGTSDLPTAAEVVRSLRDQGLLVMEVRLVADETLTSSLNLLNPANWLPIRSLDVELSLQQVAVMLRSGLTLLAALRTVAEQAERVRMGKIWSDISLRIQEGGTFADSLALHPCFSRLVVQLARVGEQSGTLDRVLVRAAESIQRRREIIRSLITALTYPAIVLLAALGVTGFMMIWVIPKLKTFLASMGKRLPPITQALVDLSDVVSKYGLHFVAILTILAIALVVFYSSPQGRLIVDTFLLRIPVLGKLLRLGGTAVFARGMGILVQSGVTILEALRTVEDLVGNRYLSRCVSRSRDSIMRGGRLADCLADRRAFMPMLSRMVAVGDASGTLDDVLDEIAVFHENQLQAAIRQLSALVEPAIILFVGGIVGFVYIAFFMALFAAGGSG